MAFDLYRRTSTGLPHRDAVPPPAPPLPPQRSATGEPAPRANFLNRIIGGTRRVPVQQETSHELRSQLLYSQRYGSKSRTVRHKTGLRIRALDVNQARTHAVLAGGKILKTVRIDDHSCVEDFNLRNTALRHAWNSSREGEHGSRSGRSSEDTTAIQQQTFDIEDVAWSNGPFSSYIATAAANGRIMLYDLDRPAVEVCALQEHTRQVHKVDFSPLEGRFLLSGSQDGTVRLWDLRNASNTSSIFQGRSDGVRHTKWSPTSTWYFALATDSGVVQRWDIRQTRSPVLKMAAHTGTCNSIDWHPDGKHLASAGKDQVVKIWNVASERRPRRPAFQFVAPKEVQNVRWRPPCYIPQGHDNHFKQCTQLATSYRRYPVVHVWDLRRPHLPFKEIYHEINSGTTDMLWHSKDVLWTVGPEGEFSQTDILFAPKTIAQRPAQVLSQSPLGELSFATPPTTCDAQHTEKPGEDEFAIEEEQTRSSPSKLLSKSVQGDDSFEENFLSTSYTRRHSRTPSLKSTRSYGSTPPSAEDFAKPVVLLDESLRRHVGLQPHQISLTGPTPGARAPQAFARFARDLRAFDMSHLGDMEKADKFMQICEERALLLQKLSRYRDAQVWRILGLSIAKLLQSRAKLRSNNSLVSATPSMTESQMVQRPAPAFATNARRLISRGSSTTRSQSQRGTESTSNVPTPLAKPVRQASTGSAEMHSDIEDTVQLPDSLVSDHFYGKPSDHRSHRNSDDVFETSNMLKPTGSAEERRRDMLSSYRGQPRIPLDLTDSYQVQSNGAHAIPPRLDRHDSGDSFLMFSTSSESQRRFSGQHSSFSFSGSNPMAWRQGRANERTDSDAHARRVSGFSGNSEVIIEDSGNGSQGASSGSPQLSPKNRDMDNVEDELAGRFSGSFETESELKRIEDRARSATNDQARDEQRPSTSHKDYPKPTKPADASGIPMDVTTESFTTIEEPLKDSTNSDMGSLTNSDVLISGMHLGLDENAWETVDQFCQLLDGYRLTNDAQMASHLYAACASILMPPVPAPVDADIVLHHPVLSNVYHHLTDAVGFAASTAKEIVLSTHLLLEELGIRSDAIESTLAAYHTQLVSNRLFTPATTLRQLAYPSFPTIYEQAITNIDAGMLCTQCRNPINNPIDKTRCETCKTRQGDCPICQLPESPFDLPAPSPSSPPPRSPKRPKTPASASPSPAYRLRSAHGAKTRLWTTCALCNHASHTACAYTWHADALGGGACPTHGCLCDCTAGAYRDTKLAHARLEAETQAQVKWRPGSGVSISITSPGSTGRARQLSAGIKADDWAVGQSRAVRSVRSDLRDGAFSDGEAERRTEKVRRRRDRSGAARDGSGGGRRVRLVEPGT